MFKQIQKFTRCGSVKSRKPTSESKKDALVWGNLIQW